MPNNSEVESELKRFINGLVRRNPGQPEFHQAVREVAETILPFTFENPIYREEHILGRRWCSPSASEIGATTRCERS